MCSIKKCCKCLTCNRGERILNWFFRQIRYDEWSLSWQMFSAVCISVACVSFTMALVMIVSLDLSRSLTLWSSCQSYSLRNYLKSS